MSEAHQLPSQLSTRGSFPSNKVNLSTHHSLIPSLRMSGVIPVLLMYAFFLWTGTTYMFT